MPRFGTVPPEVPVQRSLDICAPKFRAAVEAMMADLARDYPERKGFAFETLRTPERQAFLYGFGRDYDDGRGKVTNSATCFNSWHGFGLAVDVVEKDATPWDAPMSFWTAIGEAAERNGLTWGGRWRSPDLPHVQWGKCRVSPSERSRALYDAGGLQAVWRAVGAL